MLKQETFFDSNLSMPNGIFSWYDVKGNIDSFTQVYKGRKTSYIFYDDNLKEKGTIVSDYAIRREKDNIIEFRKNVVATNTQGETFKSQELIYDQTNKKLYSTKAVQITMANGNIMNGTNFSSNETLYPWHMDQSSGLFHVTDDLGK